MEEKDYTVTLWMTNPDVDDNDDCMSGMDFATVEEARECFNDVTAHFAFACYAGVPFVMLDGPGAHEVRMRSKRALRAEDDGGEWQREIATQAGMEGGCDAYNDAMGY